MIDILATNPEAWNSWKENLLNELVEILRNPSQERHFDFTEKMLKKIPEVPSGFLDNLDSALIESVPHGSLLKDFKAILQGQDLDPLVLKDKSNRIWVRFHERKDKPGLVLNFTHRLTSLGCNIRQAFIYTQSKMGVYDWFCVKTDKAPSILKKQLALKSPTKINYETQFSQIDLVSYDDEEWVFSFRAKDKKGLLLTALQTLYELELEVVWAKVHTWGRQIEDIFGIVPKKNYEANEVLIGLKEKLESPDLEIL